MTKDCIVCGGEYVRNKKYSQAQWESQLFCSRSCRGKFNQGKSVNHSGSFKKGFDPKRIVQKHGEGHYLWVGQKASYSTIHKWLVKKYGRAQRCQDCGKTKGIIDWANISKRYFRDRNDFRQLCRKCHIAFDKENVS